MSQRALRGTTIILFFVQLDSLEWYALQKQVQTVTHSQALSTDGTMLLKVRVRDTKKERSRVVIPTQPSLFLLTLLSISFCRFLITYITHY